LLEALSQLVGRGGCLFAGLGFEVSGFGLSFGVRVKFRVLGFGFRVSGSGFELRVGASGFGLGFRVSGFELRVGASGSRLGFRVSGFGLGFRVSGFGFRVGVSGFWFRVSGFGFRVSGFGFRVSGFDSYTLEQGTVIECYLKDDCYQFGFRDFAFQLAGWLSSTTIPTLQRERLLY